MPSKALAFVAMLTAYGLAMAMPWYAQGDNFRGAQLLTPDERKQHVARLQAFKSFAECKDYMQGHYLELDRRARERGASLPPVRGDPCEVMQTMGRIR